MDLECPVIPSIATVFVVQSGFLHEGRSLDLSDCREEPWGENILTYDQSKILNWPNVKQDVFIEGW